MCLQCVTEAEVFAKSINECEIFPGWILTRATKNSDFGEWAAGDYGLVRCNDPDLVFACTILPEPTKWGDKDSEDKDLECQEYFDNIDKVAEALNTMNFSSSCELLYAMGISTADRKWNSWDVAEELMKFLWRHILEHKPRSIDEWERMARGITKEEWEEFKKAVEND